MSNEQASERAPLPRLHEIKEDVEFVSPYTNIYVEIAALCLRRTGLLLPEINFPKLNVCSFFLPSFRAIAACR